VPEDAEPCPDEPEPDGARYVLDGGDGDPPDPGISWPLPPAGGEGIEIGGTDSLGSGGGVTDGTVIDGVLTFGAPGGVGTDTGGTVSARLLVGRTAQNSGSSTSATSPQ
jgi:hypothetical protein